MIHAFDGHVPALHPTALVADNATLVGQVTLEAHANIWYGAVLRADNSPIVIGEGSNIQDNVVCHCDTGMPVQVGKNVTVGHSAVLHSCTIGDGSLIGMGAVLLNGCVIGKGSMVAAGALVTQNTVIPDGCVAMGSPAKVVRPIRPEEAADQLTYAGNYCRRAAKLFRPVTDSL